MEPPSRIVSRDYTPVSPGHDSGHSYEPTVSLISPERQSSEDEHSFERARRSATSNAGNLVHGTEHIRKSGAYEAGLQPVTFDEDHHGDSKNSRYRRFGNIMTKFWLFETAACVFSLLSLVAIIVVLINEDGKQLDQWAWSIPPNAVVSFIATLAKASMVLVLSQILSQMKWLHFQTSKSLQHMRHFDASSRGPLGSIVVIWRSKEFLASVAAGLMILSLLVDPFVQLVFSFPVRVVGDDTQAAVFLRMIDWSGDSGPKPFVPSQNIWASMNQGLAGATMNTTLTCPSGNCVWSDPIKTLGVCGSCSRNSTGVTKVCSFNVNNNSTDIENVLLTSCTYSWVLDASNNVTLDLQASLRVSYPNVALPYFSRTKWNSSTFASSKIGIMAKHSDRLGFDYNVENAVNMTHDYIEGKTIVSFNGNIVDSTELAGWNESIYITDGTILRMHAVQLPPVDQTFDETPTDIPDASYWDCEMFWCEKTIEDVRIADGGQPESYSVLEQRLAFVFGSPGLTPHGDSSLPYHIYGTYPSELGHLDEEIWNFKYRVNNTLSPVLSTFMTGYYVDGDSKVVVPFSRDSEFGQVNYASNPAAILGLAFSDDLNHSIRALADSLTETIRTSSGAIAVNGDTLVSKTFIHVRWAWLALPLAVMVITFVLLPIIAIQSNTKKVATWKGDPLALLLHRIDGLESFLASDNKHGPADLNDLADEVSVRLDEVAPFKFVRTFRGQKEGQKRQPWFAPRSSRWSLWQTSKQA